MMHAAGICPDSLVVAIYTNSTHANAYAYHLGMHGFKEEYKQGLWLMSSFTLLVTQWFAATWRCCACISMLLTVLSKGVVH